MGHWNQPNQWHAVPFSIFSVESDVLAQVLWADGAWQSNSRRQKNPKATSFSNKNFLASSRLWDVNPQYFLLYLEIKVPFCVQRKLFESRAHSPLYPPCQAQGLALCRFSINGHRLIVKYIFLLVYFENCDSKTLPSFPVDSVWLGRNWEVTDRNHHSVSGSLFALQVGQSVYSVTMWNMEIIFVLLFTNYCIIFHTNNCISTFAPPCPWCLVLIISH